MRLSNIREAPLIHAYRLINPEKSKKSYKTIQPEINKMSETFGPNFDKALRQSLFDEIEFKEIKTLMNSKNNKTQFFIQDFPQFIERADFIALFSEILMFTTNTSTTQEIYNGLNKICKLTQENQFKILISFIYSSNEKYTEDAKTILLSKCNEIQKERKIEQLSQSTIQTLMLILGTFDENVSNNFINFIETSSIQQKDEINQINDIEKLLDIGSFEPIEIEKLFCEIGPMTINNMINLNCEMLDDNLDEKRLASFLIFLINHQNWNEDKESKHLNKIFLMSINNEASNSIDDILDKKTVNWNLDNFYKMFKKQIDNMDMNQVINAFDDPKFSIKDKKNFDFFINALTKLKILTNTSQFFNFIFTKWNNEQNQIEFLSFLINNTQQNDTYSFKNYNGRKIKKNVELSNFTASKNSNIIEAWYCIDLYEVLFKLSKGIYYSQVKELFKWPIQNIPEIIVLALTSIKPESDEFLYDELLQETLPNFLTNHPSSFSMIEEVWNSNKELVIKTLCNMYESQPDLMNLSRILDITQKLKDSLLILVNCDNYVFSVNLGILAVKRDFLHMEQWLKDRINKVGDDFIEAILNYIKINLFAHCKGNSTNKENVLEKAQLSLESLAIILETLIGIHSNNKISKRINEEIIGVYKTIFNIFDEIQVQPVNSEEIEKSANALFTAMFNGEMSVKEFIDILKKYKDSGIAKETELFACILHSSLDEYRFYHQYREKELTLAAEFFGQLIKNKFLPGLIEIIALKYILEGLKKGKGPMFLFGSIALSQFIDIIQQWPKYMESLIEVKEIKNNPNLYETLIHKYNESVNLNGLRKDSSYTMNQYEDNKDEHVTYNQINNSEDNNTFYSNQDSKNEKGKTKLVRPTQMNNVTNNISIMLGCDNPESCPNPPSQDIVNQIKFIFNSMSKNNVIDKSKELKNVLKSEDIIKWFSNFFIVNRISAENNNHAIYNELISLIDNKELNKLLIKDSIYFIKRFLASENLEKDMKEKNVLKNLGSWLGIMTLQKNKPILAKDLDLKEIIFDAYEKGKLSAIINFIVRILEKITKTKVFHPKNPWIHAILSVLAELHSKSNLKPNLKFELDNLFKKLELEITSFPIGKAFDNYKMCPKSPDFQIIDSPIEHINFQKLYNKVIKLHTYLNNVISKLSNSKTPVNISQQEIANILTKALEQSIKEIINAILERSVNTSLITTRELIIKDFVFQKDTQSLINAATGCMKTLAGSLSLVTCREPLRTKVNDKLKEILNTRGINSESIEAIIGINNLEFLDIGNNYIRSYVVEKAIEKIQKDPDFLEEIEKRKNNELNQSKNEIIQKIKMLPDKLKPNENGLTEEEYKVYDYFENIYYSYSKDEQSNNIQFLNLVHKLLKEATGPSQAKSTPIQKQYSVCLHNICSLSQKHNISFSDDEQLSLLDKIITESKIDPKDSIEMAITSLNSSMNAAKTGNIQLLNVYSQLVKGWVKKINDLSKTITHKVLTSNVFIRFNQELHYYFLKKQIFDLVEYEKYFCEFLDNESTCAKAVNLLQSLNRRKVISPSNFKKIPWFIFDNRSSDYFSLFSKYSKMKSVLDKKRPAIITYMNSKGKEPNDFKNFSEKCIYNFKQIVRNMYPFESFKVENFRESIKIVLPFFQNADQVITFFIIITDFCIRGSYECSKDPRDYFYPENEAKFIYGILYGLQNSQSNKKQIFENIMFGIFQTLSLDYIKNESNFNQRPYYKLLYNLIVLIDSFSINEKAFDSGYKKTSFFLVLADILHLLEPSNYPGFALAWLDLISCQHFISNFLDQSKTNKKSTTYEKFSQIIINIFSYLKTFSDKPIDVYQHKVFFDNVYKFIFVLCNTYPEFVAGYYGEFLLYFPPTNAFIQLKNMLLSCCPKDITVPDPFRENLNDFYSKPKSEIFFDAKKVTKVPKIKNKIDLYIDNKNEKHIIEIADELNKNTSDPNYKNMINEIVLYWSQCLIKDLNDKTNSEIVCNFFVKFILYLDNENKDRLIHAILNELRYPCLQTYYFTYLLINIFPEVKDENIEEHILKNIVERLFYKPHPWGLIFCFFKLVNDENYLQLDKKYIATNSFDEILKELLQNCKEKKLTNFLSN